MKKFGGGRSGGDRGGDRGGKRFGGRDSGGRGFGGGSRGFSRDGDRPQMHDAVCDNCGKDCQVPFRPTGERPVYCSDCFDKKGGSASGGEGRGDRGDRSDRGRGSDRLDLGEKKMFDAVCDNCGNKCEVPFRPSGDKPVYCKNCFAEKRGGAPAGKASGPTKEQFDVLNDKLDKILKALSGKSPVQTGGAIDAPLDLKIPVAKKIATKKKVTKKARR